MLKICLSKNIQKSKFHDLTYAWGEWVGKEYQNENNFEIFTFYIVKITNLGQQLRQLRNMLKLYRYAFKRYAYKK